MCSMFDLYIKCYMRTYMSDKQSGAKSRKYLMLKFYKVEKYKSSVKAEIVKYLKTDMYSGGM